MILCADIGNSTVKCGVLNDSSTLSHERVPTSGDPEMVDLGLAVRRVAGVVLSVRGAIIASVVPELTRYVAVQISESIGVRPIEVTHKLHLPMELAVPVPSTIGTDRICAAAGALADGRRDAIIVDVGSAITVDLVRDGRFLGGVIMPGPRMSLFSLGDHAAALPRIDYAEQAAADRFPENIDATEPAMLLGASLGAVGGILEAVRWLEKREGAVDRHCLTGGEAEGLVARLPGGWIYEPDLTLRGMYEIAELNLPR